jgi:transcriptional regulator GlxA family with amidase domain
MRLMTLAMLLAATCAAAAPEEKHLTLPRSGPVRVAVVVSDGTTLIDIAGPMQVFDQIQAPPGSTEFQTFTVSETRKPIKAGTLTIVPDYTFADVPEADIVIEGAQSGKSPPYLDYLRQMASRGRLMLSVCTGVSKFAQAGILDGLQATTHHNFIESFRSRYPKVHFSPDEVWIHSAPTIYTAGGETSGIELALHIVELYFDHDVAVKTAREMEYRGPNWQS